MLKTLFRHRHLAWELAKREIHDRYVAHVLGWSWAILQPLAFMGVQICVFTFVFRVSLSAYPLMPFNYVTYVLSGLIPWYCFQDVLNRSCTAVTDQAGLVKQVVFPVEVLPLKTVIAAAINQAIGFVLLGLYLLIAFGSFPLTFCFLPLAMAFQCFFSAGLGYFLAGLSVFIRDARDIVQTLLLPAIYLLPIFFLPDMAPPLLQGILRINPFSHAIWTFQDLVYFGEIRHPVSLGIFLIESPLAFVLGYRFFQRVKPMFGSML